MYQRSRKSISKDEVKYSKFQEDGHKSGMACSDGEDKDFKVMSGAKLKGNVGLQGDYGNVALLLGLYFLQGIPLGLAGSVPMILQNKKISYKQQALFSLVFWPFSIKLLWAPLVDALFFKKFGRRKTWLVPTQYLIGLCMIGLSTCVDQMLDGPDPAVYLLTGVFLLLNFLAATQDIAVDGWALTMLQRRNVGYASTCNSVGQTAGYFVGNVVLLAFSSEDFCNKYLRSSPQPTGILTLSGFLFFWGVVFLVSTTFVWILKREVNSFPVEVDEHGVLGMYKLLLKIFQLSSVRELVINLLTVKVGFAAADAVTGLKLVEAGVKKETLAFLAVPLVPLQILLPLLISGLTSGSRPLDIFKRAMPFRLLFGLVFAALVYWTHGVRPAGQEEFPTYYFVVILSIYALHQVATYSMFVSLMAFFARISDPNIGGTYMTLLNTLSNLGSNWPGTAALWFVDLLTWTTCVGGASNPKCGNPSEVEACIHAGGSCVTTIDGYYVESVICLALGCLWLIWRGRSLSRIQSMSESSWKVA